MRLRLHALLLVVVAACWLAPHASADNTDAAAALEEAHSTKPTSSHSPNEKSLRIATTDDISAVLVATKEAPKDHKAKPGSETKTKPNAGPAPAIVLAAGGVTIGIVALAFQRRRARQSDKDDQDPLRQAFLFHDMDYAAM